MATLSAAATLVAAGLGYAVWVGGEAIAAYAAKTLCSCVFVSGRDPASCLDEDLHDYAPWITAAVDRPARAATAAAFRLRRARAEYREGLGCALR